MCWWHTSPWLCCTLITLELHLTDNSYLYCLHTALTSLVRNKVINNWFHTFLLTGAQVIHLLRGGRTPSHSRGLHACRIAASYCSGGIQSTQFYRRISIKSAQTARRPGWSLPANTASPEAPQIKIQGVSPWNGLIVCNTSEVRGMQVHAC